jgi:peptidyl-prolyl cis-trans isomerase B (cyclophilin B)
MRLFAPLLLLLASITAHAAEQPQVKIVTSAGEIVLELYPEKAPKTVANFLQYVDDGFYSGTIFHRVIDGFMIQGGGFTADYQQKKTRSAIENEADNGLRNSLGTIAMARTSDPHSATAQFFINVTNNQFLDFRERTQRAWGYAVFGKVIGGMATVNTIRTTRTGAGGPFAKDVPLVPVTILRMERIAP